jgi:hypothetical protein
MTTWSLLGTRTGPVRTSCHYEPLSRWKVRTTGIEVLVGEVSPDGADVPEHYRFCPKRDPKDRMKQVIVVV